MDACCTPSARPCSHHHTSPHQFLLVQKILRELEVRLANRCQQAYIAMLHLAVADFSLDAVASAESYAADRDTVVGTTRWIFPTIVDFLDSAWVRGFFFF